MAKRPTGGKSGKNGSDIKQNFQQNQFGLPDAYTVLQGDFLELKKAYIGNEHQLVEMQQQYFILQQSYQKLQQDSQAQQAKLLENLEKGYEAYNEKFMKVEELEDKLNKCNKELKEVKEQSENQVKVVLHLQDESNKVRHQKQAFEDAVRKSLANIGLSLDIDSDYFQINILDYTKLGQLCQKVNNPTHGDKIIELEHHNASLQQTLQLLQEFSQKQQEKLTKATDLLQKKTKECRNLKKGIHGNENNGVFMVDVKELEKIAVGLSEMYDFVLELKKSISDQNSWIDMLVEAQSEYRKSHIPKGDKIIDVKSKLSDSGATNPSVLSGGQSQSKKNKRKKKKATGQNPGGKAMNTFSEAASANKDTAHTEATNHSDAVQVPDEVEKLEEFHDFIVVPSKKNSAFRDREFAKPHSDSASPFLSLQTKPRGPMNLEPKSLQHELHHMSSLSLHDRMKTWEGFGSDTAGEFSQGVTNDKSKQKQAVSTDICPICNLVFDNNSNLLDVQSHINSHFKD